MDGSDWVLAGLTGLLAVLTAWYAWSTHRTIGLLEQAREAASRPYVTVTLVPWAPKLVKLRVQNVGSGPAIGLTGKIETKLKDGKAHSVDWSYQVLQPGAYEEFGVPLPEGALGGATFNLDQLKNLVSEIEAHFTCASNSGRRYEQPSKIDVSRLTADWIASRMMATQDHPERIFPRVAKALEDIAKRAG